MAITIASDVSWDPAAWEKFAYFALRPENYYDAVADVRGEHLTADGNPSVSFTITSNLPIISTSLNESTDVAVANLDDSVVTVVLAEYGNVVQTTALVRGTSFLPVDPVVANVVGYNAGVTIDSITRDELEAGDNVRFSAGGGALARATLEADNNLDATDIRYVVAKLRGASVQTHANGLYASFIHPDVSVDLTSDTDLAGWRAPKVYSEPGAIWVGEIGSFQGCRFIETPRAPLFADGGSGNVDVYGTLFCGRQALAKAYSRTDGNGPFPRLSPSPVTDRLRRFTGIGWYWLGGYKRFREESLYRVESASSIGDNA